MGEESLPHTPIYPVNHSAAQQAGKMPSTNSCYNAIVRYLHCTQQQKPKGVTMSDQVIRLVYPPHLLDVPIINQLIHRYNLTINILRAQVAPDEGWVDIQLTGTAAAIEDATIWLSGQGIIVEHLA